MLYFNSFIICIVQFQNLIYVSIDSVKTEMIVSKIVYYQISISIILKK